MTVPAAPTSTSVFSHRPYAFYWSSRVASTVAAQMQTVAVGWQVYEITHSPLDLGLVGLVQFLPAVLLTLMVGHVGDRYDRRLVLRVAQGVAALAAAGLAIGSFNGWLTRESIFALVCLFGTARAFEQPLAQSLVPALVPPEILPRAIALSSSATQLAVIAGPALGGLIYVLGATTDFTVCCVLFFIASTLASLIRIERPAPKRVPASLSTLFAGISYIRRKPVVLGAISLDLFAVLLGGATALLPIYARDILVIGPLGLGLLRSSTAVGALSMSLFLANHSIKRRVGRVMFASVALFGCATILFALSTTFWLSAAALIVLGASDQISVVIRNSLVQLETPDDMRGRVSAVHSLFIGTSNTLGEFESGVTAAWFGTVPAVLIGGLGTVLVVLIWMRLFPDLVRVERLGAKPSA